jgi:ribosomal protein S21
MSASRRRDPDVHDSLHVERQTGESIEGLLRRFKRAVSNARTLAILHSRAQEVTPVERRRGKDRRAARRRLKAWRRGEG